MSLSCCSPWGLKELDMTYRLNNKKHKTLNLGSKEIFRLKIKDLGSVSTKMARERMK